MNFKKFAKIANDLAKSLNIPELKDQRGPLRSFLDIALFRGNTNIVSILVNEFENIKNNQDFEDDIELFEKLLEKNRIGEDEIQYLVFKILEQKSSLNAPFSPRGSEEDDHFSTEASQIWDNIRVILSLQTYKHVTNEDGQFEYKRILGDNEEINFQLSKADIEEVFKAYRRADDYGRITPNISSNQQLQFWKVASDGPKEHYIYKDEAQKYLKNIRENLEVIVGGEKSYGVERIRISQDKIQIKLSNNKNYNLNSVQWSSLINELEKGNGFNVQLEDTALYIEKKPSIDGMVPDDPQDFIAVYTARDGAQHTEIIHETSTGVRSNVYEIKVVNMVYFQNNNEKEKWKDNPMDFLDASIDISYIKNLDLDIIKAPTKIEKIRFNDGPDDSIKKIEIFYDPKGEKQQEIEKENEKERMEAFLDEAREKIETKFLKKFYNKIGAKYQDIELKAFNVVYRTKDNKFKPLGFQFQEPKISDDRIRKKLGTHHEDLTDELIRNKDSKDKRLFVAFMQKNTSNGEEIRQMYTPEEFNDYIDTFDKPKNQTQERLIKLIKPLIREKLKRKQNGKKNLRN